MKLSTWSALLATLSVTWVTGCSKSADVSVAPEAVMVEELAATSLEPGYDFQADAAGEADMLERGLVATPAASGASLSFEAPPMRDARGNENKELEQAREELAKKKAEEALAKDGDQAPDHGRQIIYTANMYVSVYDLEQSMVAAEELPQRYGGWVHRRTNDMLVLRLPAAALDAVMTQLTGYGVVESRNLQAQDVSTEYVDLEARIEVLRKTQAQLLELLGQCKTVEEALHVRQALDNTTMELEQALGRMRQLSDMIAFSTLTVQFVERGPMDSVPTSNDPFRWVDSLGVEATEWR